jgi:hypothetical protein
MNLHPSTCCCRAFTPDGQRELKTAGTIRAGRRVEATGAVCCPGLLPAEVWNRRFAAGEPPAAVWAPGARAAVWAQDAPVSVQGEPALVPRAPVRA